VASETFSPEAGYLAADPINQMRGVDEIVARHLLPLKQAFPDLERRDDVFMAGVWKGGTWVSATGCYYGVPRGPWLGLKPVDRWIALRFGEFYRLDGDRIVDAYTMIDLVDVLRQYGVSPVPPALGVDGLWPGPAAQDGLRLQIAPAADTAKSLALVEAMIFQGMHGFDGVNHETMHFERYFTGDMMWFGPGGTGTTRGLDGFMRHHEIPFNEAWPDFKGGNHVARFADGPYICSTGWPSIRGTHTGGHWMGLTPTGKAFEMRVMDWWRREGELLSENWVFIDVPHTFKQFGRDLLAEAVARQSR
jgi:predicted ester cyclase